MGHISHYVKVWANQPSDAIQKTLSILSDSSDLYDYFDICGTVNQNGGIYIEDNDIIDKDELDVDKINENFNNYIISLTANDTPAKIAFDKCAMGSTDKEDWYFAIEHAKAMYETLQTRNNKPFDCWSDTFNSYKFNEFGITDSGLAKNKGNILYLVLVDFHV